MEEQPLTELPLAFEPRMLVPFIMAWRATSRDLPTHLRAIRVAAQLKEWGYPLLDAKLIASIVGDYANVLEMGPHEPPLQCAPTTDIVSSDTKCCVCDCPVLDTHVHGRPYRGQQLEDNVTIWSLTGPPRKGRMIDKICTDCGTNHMYAQVETHTYTVVLRVENLRKVSEHVANVKDALRSELGVCARYAKARDATAPALTMTRGFDAPKVDLRVLGEVASVVAWVKAQLPSTNKKLRRYRAKVLELPMEPDI